MNATNLFERPDRRFHNSESWWTAFFALYVLQEAHSRTLSPVRVCTHGEDGRFSWLNEPLDLSQATFDNFIVEAPLSEAAFGLTYWPNEYRGLKPDISFIRKEDLSATFIEVKTIGASVAGNIDLYENLCKYLRKQEQKWEAEIYYLISCGHESKHDWELITTNRCKIILWEYLFDKMKETSLAKIHGISLAQYSSIQDKPVYETNQSKET